MGPVNGMGGGWLGQPGKQQQEARQFLNSLQQPAAGQPPGQQWGGGVPPQWGKEWGGGQLINSKKYTHDEVLAHAALLEGDATIVMFNYQQGGGAGSAPPDGRKKRKGTELVLEI